MALKRMQNRRKKAREVVRRRLLGFMPKLFDVVENIIGEAALRKSMLNSDFSYASHFAGFGTVERCLRAACSEARSRGYGLEPRLTASCDVDRGCQKLLCKLGNDDRADPCVFQDVLHTAGVPSNFEAKLGKLKSTAAKIRQLRNYWWDLFSFRAYISI